MALRYTQRLPRRGAWSRAAYPSSLEALVESRSARVCRALQTLRRRDDRLSKGVEGVEPISMLLTLELSGGKDYKP